MSGMFNFVALTDADWDRGWVRVTASSFSTAEVGDLAILIDNTSGNLGDGRVELIAYGDAVGEVGITVELPTRMGEPGVVQAHGQTWDNLVVPTPEQGEWTVRTYGADVDPAGEEVLLSVGEQQVANQRPVPAFDLTYDGTTLALDASASRDADGELTTYRWFVDNGETDTVRDGRQASIEVPAGRPRAVSLQVTDDRGDSEFLTKRFAAIDVKPGAGVETVNPTSKGVTPVAVLSFGGFDAAALDVATPRFGYGKVVPKSTGVNRRDVDGDGTRDLVVQIPTREMGIRPGDTSLCMTGVAEDGESFLGCDGVRQVPAG